MSARSGGAPRVEFLLRRLVLLAGDVRDLLASGDWEGALPVQDEFAEAFAALQSMVERGVAVLGPQHANDLAQLAHVHAENERLARDLHGEAGAEIASISNVRRMSRAYAPLGGNHRPVPRYVDGSA